MTEHGKSRSALLDDQGAPLTHGLPAAGLCADELYVRTHHVGAANVGWRNLALLPSLRTRVLRAMRPPHALPPTPADSPARPLRLLFTREDAGSRRLIVPDPKHACAVLGAQLLRRMPSTQPLREQAMPRR